MQRDEVTARHQLGKADQFDAQLAGLLGRDVGVVRQGEHGEPGDELGHEPPDPAQTDDAQGLAREFDAFPLGPLPAAGHKGGVGLGDVARLRQDQGDGVLRRRQHVGQGGVHHRHAEAGGGSEVDVVETDTGAAHHDEILPGFQDLCGDLRRRADDQRLRTLNR